MFENTWGLYNIYIMLRRILFAIILSVAIFFAILGTFPPKALPADAPADVFSATRAAETVRMIARSPRLVGSPAYEIARDYLLRQLEGLGFSTETQDLILEGVKVENTLGRLSGSSSRAAILLVAHLDSVAGAPGAMDDASGVAEVLETARALKAGPALENAIIVLFTGPEENCCYGARAFASLHPWAKDARLVVNVDAGGVNGPSILAATGPQEGWLIREMAGILPDPIGSSAIEAFGSPATDYTLALRRVGFRGVDFNLSWTKRIHTPLDEVGHLNLSSLQHQGEHMLAVARHFGNISLEFVSEPNPTYFDLFGKILVHYPASWTIPLFVLLTLGWGVALVRVFQKKWLNGWGMGLGALALLLSLLTVPLILLLIQWGILQPVLESSRGTGLSRMLVGDSLLSNSLRGGSVVLAILAVVSWYGLLGKWYRGDRDDLLMGTYLFLYMAAGFSIVFYPAVSYILIWPLLLTLLPMLIRFSRINSTTTGKWIGFFGWTLASLVAIVLFVPGILIAALSVDIQSIYLVPVFVAILFSYLMPPFIILFQKPGQTL